MGSQRVRTQLSNFNFHDPYTPSPLHSLSPKHPPFSSSLAIRGGKKETKSLLATQTLSAAAVWPCLETSHYLQKQPLSQLHSACAAFSSIPPNPLVPSVSASTAPGKTCKSGEQKRCLLKISVSMCGK